MEIILFLAVVNSLFSTLVRSCTISSVDNGMLLSDKEDILSPGESVAIVCDVGSSTHDHHVMCTEDGTWEPSPHCSKVNVRFDEFSMIKYVYPIPYDSSNGSIVFSFSTQHNKSSGVLVKLTSRKMRTPDSLTAELVDGYLAVTMQLRSRSQNIVAYCHSDVLLNDNLVHRVSLIRDTTSLLLSVDNRQVSCSYPSAREFTFSALRTIQVGHLSPSWGSHYGFSGCISDLVVNGLDLLVLADVAVNTDRESEVSVDNIQFTATCGEQYKAPYKPPTKIQSTAAPYIIPDYVDGTLPPDLLDSMTVLVVTSVSLTLIVLVLLFGILGCRAFNTTKGSYLVDESKLTLDNVEQEYYL